MAPYGVSIEVLWGSMGYYGILWGIMGIYGVLWGIMRFYGVLWGIMGCLRGIMGSL